MEFGIAGRESVSESSPVVDEFLACHQTMRAMPESTARILQATRDPNCSIEELLQLIRRDAAISARIMKTVNSSFYALQTKITRLDLAVAYLGLKVLKGIMISSSLADWSKNVAIGDYSTRDLWDHSIGVAILSRELAVHSKSLDPEDAFLAGILHDVGLLLAAQSETEKCQTVFDLANAREQPYTDIEQSIFGFDHCQLGERLSQGWNFPEQVTSVSRWHHSPESAPEEFKAICRHVFIADSLCCQANVGFPLTCNLQEVDEQTLETAHLSREIAAEVAAKLPVLMRLHLG